MSINNVAVQMNSQPVSKRLMTFRLLNESHTEKSGNVLNDVATFVKIN
jgi:hypothetical protein